MELTFNTLSEVKQFATLNNITVTLNPRESVKYPSVVVFPCGSNVNKVQVFINTDGLKTELKVWL